MLHFVENDFVFKGEHRRKNDVTPTFIVQPGLQPDVTVMPTGRGQYAPIPLSKIFNKDKKRS